MQQHLCDATETSFDSILSMRNQSLLTYKQEWGRPPFLHICFSVCGNLSIYDNMFYSRSSQEICWMYTIALEWQRLLSLSATPALLIFQKLKGKLLVEQLTLINNLDFWRTFNYFDNVSLYETLMNLSFRYRCQSTNERKAEERQP